ncbi:hypothetical protein Q7C36_014400 [Tachysurus vachellii]|uniref:Uncharacterized protein n=1 Tax=Tachysurus vachellii TaxID=175792 RepID=A0AA88SEL9_TACVA|nr:hypothetical protein Q7C36_014400 [Tachysurus vachellii]
MGLEVFLRPSIAALIECRSCASQSDATSKESREGRFMGKADQFCCACASCEVNLSLETHSSQSRAAVLTALLSEKFSMSLLSRS